MPGKPDVYTRVTDKIIADLFVGGMLLGHFAASKGPASPGAEAMAVIDPHSIVSWLLAAAFAYGWARVERQLRKW
jgi:hypothetical protein